MGKKHKKYTKWITDPNYDARYVELPTEDYAYLRQSQGRDDMKIPTGMLLPIRGSPGFFLGLPSGPGGDKYVGMPQGGEGNFLVVGGNGGGKSAGIAKPTMRTWTGTMCVTDIKGELSDWYAGLEQHGLVSWEGIIFDPTKADSPGYDPFWWLLRDDAGNLLNNVREIAMAIVPVSPDDKQPFWAEAEQGILAAALLYYFRLGLSFSETMCMILSLTMSKLCENLSQHGDVCEKYLCELIGTHVTMRRSMSEHMDECWDISGYSRQISETRDLIIQPHELSTLDDVLLLTPYGFSRVKKFRLYDEEMKSMLLADSKVIRIEATSVAPSKASGLHPIRCTATLTAKTIADNTKNNEGAKIMSIEERTANANRRIDTAERKRRQEERSAQEAQRKKDSRRSYIIGDLVAKYFPDVLNVEPGTDTENQSRFEHLESFLYVLSTDYDLVEKLRERAAQLTSDDPDGEWRTSN